MFSQKFNLADLLTINGGDGTEGFVINGIDRNDNLGVSVSSAGDFNGDGIDDLIVGSSGTYNPSRNKNRPGKSHLIFGKSTFDAEINLSDITSNSLVINGIDRGDFSGYSVSSAGDINGDNIDDLIIGARSGDGNNNNQLSAGESYVVFGGNSLGTEINLADIVSGDGSNGFVVYGDNNGDVLGNSVSVAGDINGDDIDDMIISAQFANGDNSKTVGIGKSYVVFGGNNFGATLNLSDITSSDGNNGFVINGIDGYDFSGASVSDAGDINGDGIDDIIISSRRASGKNNETSYSGESYVIFGGNNLGTEINLSDIVSGNGSNGFVINGVDGYDFSGTSVSDAGDINGDGIDDLIISADSSNGNNNNTNYSGESYVVFGGNSLGAEINLSDIVSGDGSNGFVVYGIDSYDFSGTSVSNAGDVNGDGIDDFVIGARRADGDSNKTEDSGESYVVFGGNSLGAEINLSDIVSGDGSNGFVVYGIDSYDFSGTSVSDAGDVNGDGIDDFVIGANLANGKNNNREDAGESYVIFGKADPESITTATPSQNNNLSGTTSSDRLESGAGNDISRGGSGDDTVDGDNGRDRLFGDRGKDNLSGGKHDDFLQGGSNNDTVMGGDGNDIVYGDEGRDTLLGGSGMDVLSGGAGNDLIDGGSGKDKMLGGAGADTFVIRPGDIGNIIYDFEDNRDFISLGAGLTFSDLTIADNGLDTGTFISHTSSGDVLVVMVNVNYFSHRGTDSQRD